MIVRLIFCVSFLVIIPLPRSNAQSQSGELTILHTNDLHSRLTGYAPESEYTPLTIHDDQTTGGFARIARVLKTEKANDPDHVLVVDAGDFLMGTFFHALEPVDGFQLRLMNGMGYDAISLGNHEFDFGIITTGKIIRHSKERGEIPPILLANIQFDPVSSEDDLLADLYKENIVSPYKVIQKDGLRIGVFGILGYDATDVAPFIKPARITDPLKTAKKIAAQLKNNEHTDLVICLSHSGLSRNNAGEWEGEDVKLARKVQDIDIIISGHSHTCLSEPLFVDNTMIVQTGAYGANVGKLRILCQNGQVDFRDYELIAINDSIRGDFSTHASIENQKSRIQNQILDNLQIDYDTPVVSTGFDLICDEENKLEDSNLGPFLADAIRYYVNQIDGDSTDIAMIAAGVIRDQLVEGKSSIADIFRISSMGWGYDSIPGYPLSKVYVTGNELKKIIEVLLFAYHSSPSNYCYYSGLKVMYDPSKGFLRKVQSIEVGDSIKGYKPVDFSKRNDLLYSISANAYMLEFVGMLKKMTFGLVRVTPKNSEGYPIKEMSKSLIDFDLEKKGLQEGKEWMATYHYIRQFQDVNQDGIPDIPNQYRNPHLRVVPVSGN
jgi:5'-nucleotidase/UDP-sugar diphosphatase